MIGIGPEWEGEESNPIAGVVFDEEDERDVDWDVNWECRSRRSLASVGVPDSSVLMMFCV